MIDKYNARLDRVDELLDKLSFLINDLLSLIKDIRTTLGQCKQRIYNNLEQVKEVIEGNDITGTEVTVKAIEDALEAGDKAIDEAEATLEGVKAAVDCSEEYCNDTDVNAECGEMTETETETDYCSVCSFSVANGRFADDCTVCAQGTCSVDVTCSEGKPWTSDANPGCEHSVTYNPFEKVETDASCQEITREGLTNNPPSGCTYTCDDSSSCQQLPMPENCTYTCIDGGNGCSYEGDDCSYSSSCGQLESCNQHTCNQHECDQYDCGEPCGETCHMTNSGGSEGDCSEGSCGEDDGSDDGPCNQYDCSEYDCGEPCGESCGLF